MFDLVGRTLCRTLVRDRLEGDSETGDRAVNNVDEHAAKHLQRRNGRDFLHFRPIDELPLENASEDSELVGELLAEFVYEPRREGGIFTAAVSDSYLPFERKRLVRVSELFKRAVHERLLRDKVRYAVATECAAHCRLLRYGDFRKMHEHRRCACLERIFELVDDDTLLCFCFCHINWTKRPLTKAPGFPLWSFDLGRRVLSPEPLRDPLSLALCA